MWNLWSRIYQVSTSQGTYENACFNKNWERSVLESESKVLQCFINIKHNSAVLDIFAEVVKVMNHTELWHADLAWYSLSITHQFASLAWSTALEFMVLGLSDLFWSSRFLQSKQNFLNYLYYNQAPLFFTPQMFLVASAALYPCLNL